MVSEEHLDFALEAVKRVNREQIAGDIVECGVWKAGMTMGTIYVNQRNNTDRNFWLFDTFEGLPEPTSDKNGIVAQQIYRDIHDTNKEKSKDVVNREKRRSIESGKWNYGPLDVVKNNVYYTGYPKERIHFVQGKVEDTLPKTILPDKIAVLRLDTDWYESTNAEMDYLWDRLQPGGVLIIDDFCSWQGSATAIREFFTNKLQLDANEVNRLSGNPCMHYWKPK